MTVGEPFNPFEKFCGLFVPNWLARRTEVSHGAKMCYGRLMQYHGRGPQCNPRESILGRELGVSERTCCRLLAQLKKHKLIKVHRRGLRRSNSYEFLWHDWMTDFRPDRTGQSQRPSSSGPDQPELAAPLIRDSVERESKEENNPCSPLSGDRVNDDDSLTHQCEEIWNVYPKKVGKPSAHRAIKQAIRKFGFQHVMEGTRQYLENSPEYRFIPFPQKFFRDERFNDAAAPKQNPERVRQGIHVTNPDAYPGGEVKL